VLLWKREGNESIGETLKRQPEVIQSYTQEWQGEAICWLNNYVFYTVSDDDGEPPLYVYTKPDPEGIETPSFPGKAEEDVTKVIRNGQLYILRNGHAYNALGAEIR
jgi:hypothetical protein